MSPDAKPRATCATARVELQFLAQEFAQRLRIFGGGPAARVYVDTIGPLTLIFIVARWFCSRPVTRTANRSPHPTDNQPWILRSHLRNWLRRERVRSAAGLGRAFRAWRQAASRWFMLLSCNHP